MSTGARFFGLLAGAMAAGAWIGHTVPGQAQVAKADFTWRGRLAAGKTIEIRGINGDVSAEIANGSDVEVSAIKTSRRSDPEDVRIEVVPHDDGVTICAIYPAPRHKPDNECEPGGSHSNTENNDVKVRFMVKVPAGVRFEGHTVNGDVAAKGLKSDVALHTVNGEVEGTTTGYAEAGTVNGSIYLAMGGANWPRHLAYSTVNGGITLELPEGIKADVEASTLNGEIVSDFPLTVGGSRFRFSPRKLSATIGDGGPLLSLRTINGTIELKRAR